MEYLERGCLRDVLHDTPELPFDRKASFALDAARGMEYLHSLHRMHRDLKSGG